MFLPVLALLCCFFAGGAYAQRVAVTLKATDAPLEQVLDAIAGQHGLELSGDMKSSVLKDAAR